MSISLGLVGLGAFGGEFAELFAGHPLVSRVALCDREQDRIKAAAAWPTIAKKLKSSDVYATLDDALKSDLDAVVIITQPWLHAPQAVKAMEAGKHVYSAVPVMSVPNGDEILEWCDKLVKTVRKTGMRYMMGETTYYRPQAMYCRRRRAEGAFGDFVHSDAQYFHDVDSPGCNLRDVRRARLTGAAGKEWEAQREGGAQDGPMHYPTHSVSGPLCVMGTYVKKLCAWGLPAPEDDSYFAGSPFCNETALMHLANGATARICEWRKIGHPGEEMFSVFGTSGSFQGSEGEAGSFWTDKGNCNSIRIGEMRDPLPDEVFAAFKAARGGKGVLGGHGGSHAYLVHEFVSAIAANRHPAINVWEAVRYMAPGVIAHKSAMQEGEPMPVPDWGNPS